MRVSRSWRHSTVIIWLIIGYVIYERPYQLAVMQAFKDLSNLLAVAPSEPWANAHFFPSWNNSLNHHNTSQIVVELSCALLKHYFNAIAFHRFFIIMLLENVTWILQRPNVSLTPARSLSLPADLLIKIVMPKKFNWFQFKAFSISAAAILFLMTDYILHLLDDA